MTSDNLSALIARLEAATESSRELDAEIGRYKAADFLGFIPDGPQYGCCEYTASLDAALTLVEEPLGFSLEYRRYGTCNVVIFDRVWGKLCDAAADTPALALCIAALKARTTAPTGEHTTS